MSILYAKHFILSACIRCSIR